MPYSWYAANTNWVYNWLAGRTATVEVAKDDAFPSYRKMKRHLEVLDAIHQEEK